MIDFLRLVRPNRHSGGACWIALFALVGPTLFAQSAELPDVPPPAENAYDVIEKWIRKGPDAEPVMSDAEIKKYLQPESGEWLVDEEGRQYFVEELGKVEGQYRRIGENRIRLYHGIVVDLAGETEENFLVKIFRTDNIESPEPRRARDLTAEQKAEAKTHFVASLGSSDRLEFGAFDAGLPRAGMWRNGFDIADMNGDGHQDIVHGPPRRTNAPPVIFLGDGKGQWRLWSETKFPREFYDYGDVAVADFNRDGKQDFALASHLRGIVVLVGDGQGAFTLWSEGLPFGNLGRLPPGTHLTSRSLVAADWDRDGDDDLLIISEGPRAAGGRDRASTENPLGIFIFANGGDGTWTNVAVAGQADGLYADSLAAGDLDGNGSLDLISGSSLQGHKAIIFLQNEDGRPVTHSVESIRDRSYVWAAVPVDIDNDGRLDLALTLSSAEAGEWVTTVEVFHNRATESGGLRWERQLVAANTAESDGNFMALGAADLDGDGRPDLVSGAASGEISVFLQRADGSFDREAAPELAELRSGCRVYSLALDDLDGDLRPDLSVAFAGELCPSQGSLRAFRNGAKSAAPVAP